MTDSDRAGEAPRSLDASTESSFFPLGPEVRARVCLSPLHTQHRAHGIVCAQ